DALTAWCLLLVQVGAADAAARYAGAQHDPRARLAMLALARGEDAVADGAAQGPDAEASADALDDDDALFETLRPSVDERAVAAFTRFFAGRRDLYARQWHDARRRRTGYRPVREPVTDEVVRAHLAGRITMGQYLLFPDATVSCGVLDLDLEASAEAVLTATHGEGASALEHSALRAYVERVHRRARDLGVPLAAEDSGGRGAHLWVFFEPRRPARVARDLLGQLVSAAGAPPPEVRVEVFPKQDLPGPRGLSNLVKLPLGLHQKTLRRCPLLDARLEPYDDPLAGLDALRPVAPAMVDALIGRRVAPLPAPDLEPAEAAPPLPSVSSPRTLAEALRAIEPGKPTRDACDRMLDGCAVLRALVDKAYERRHLEPAEARALVYTIGLVGPEPALIDEVLAAAHVSFEQLRRARGGLPSPTGCKRIAALAPRGVRCEGCPGRGALPYTTPALFATGERPPAPPRVEAFASWMDADERVVEGPVSALGRTLDRIERRLQALAPHDPEPAAPTEHLAPPPTDAERDDAGTPAARDSKPDPASEPEEPAS
ncbi:MAG: hypothetical protein KC543_10395, partial [Myxococcales bacterium]|nr:hypothetical protein [Myxococcales bacterium]